MFTCTSCYVNTEIITASVIGTAIAATGFFGWDSLKTQTYCRFRECCDERYVNFDLDSKEVSVYIIFVCKVFINFCSF